MHVRYMYLLENAWRIADRDMPVCVYDICVYLCIATGELKQLIYVG